MTAGVLTEFVERRKLLTNLRFQEDKQRLTVMLQWIEAQSELAQVLAQLRAEVDSVKLLPPQTGFRRSPQTVTPQEVHAFGLYLLEQCRAGSPLNALAYSLNITPRYGGRTAQGCLDEAMDQYVNPFLDFVEKKIRDLVQRRPERVSEAKQDSGPSAPELNSGKRFRVALSFAGENRGFVSQVADELCRHLQWQQVFYDDYFKSELARLNLDTHLQSIYHDQSELIVLFLCADYERKDWCRLEWRAVRDVIKNKRDDEVMLFRFDDTPVKGLFSIDGYVSLKRMTPAEAAGLILERLGSTPKTAIAKKSDPAPLQSSGNWILLGPHVVKAERVYVQKNRTITAIIRATTADENAIFANLRDRKGLDGPMRFAHKDDAWLVRLESADHVSEGDENLWTIELKIHPLEYGGNFMSEISTQGYSADDIAKLRAMRLLLNDPGPQHAQPGVMSSLNGLITGIGTPLKADHCPIIELHKSWKGDRSNFLVCARLLSVFYLRLTNVVANINHLSLEQLSPEQLVVRFRGTRKQIFINSPATEIAVEGICHLDNLR